MNIERIIADKPMDNIEDFASSLQRNLGSNPAAGHGTALS